MPDETARVTSPLEQPARIADPITREALYDLVWSKPMLRVAEDCGVSSSYMARVCTELRVPRPAPGYWTQAELGRAPERPALPAARQGDVVSWRHGATLGTVERIAKKTETSVRTKEEVVSEQAKRGRPRLKPQKDAVHPLLKDVRHFYLKSRDTRTGFLRPYKRMLVDIVTSERRLDGALEVANALFCALTFKGHRVSFGSTQPRMRRMEVNLREVPSKSRHPLTVWEPDRATVLYVGTIAVGLTLYETTEFVESVYVNGKYLPVRDLTAERRRRYSGPAHWTTTDEVPSGRLCLQAYCPTSWRVNWVKRWQETKEGTLLSMVPDIVQALEAVGPELTPHLEEAERKQQEEQRQWDEQWRRWKEEEERARLLKAHETARQELYAAIAAWDEARRIEAYFSQVLVAAEALEDTERKVLLERVSQARALVGGVHPLESLARWKSPQERL